MRLNNYQSLVLLAVLPVGFGKTITHNNKINENRISSRRNIRSIHRHRRPHGVASSTSLEWVSGARPS